MGRRIEVAGSLLAIGLLAATAAQAQGSGKIPVEQDVKKVERIDRRLGRPEPTLGTQNVAPDNPSGVAGFNGPPGTVGDSVNSYGPLPPGAPGNETE